MAIDALNQRIADDTRHRENRARLAHAYARVKTIGLGVVEFEERIDFGLTFVERPFVACGWEMINADELEEQYPFATAYVTDWDTTERGHYVGAWVAVMVDVPSVTDPGGSSRMSLMAEVDDPASPKIWHHFTFSAVALKDVPTGL